MKKLLIIALIISIKCYSQTHLCYNIYYYKNPKHILKQYKNILIITNASFKSINYMKRIAEKFKYNMVISNQLFPPIKNYTDNEIKEVLNANNIDGILYCKIISDSVISTYSLGTYSIPNSFGVGNSISKTYSKHYSAIEIALVNTDSKDKKELYCTGGAKGNSFDVMNRTFAKLVEKFDEISIAIPYK